MFDLEQYRAELLRLHNHLCPRQVLGLRMGELAGEILGLSLPQSNKRLIAFVETDGCFADGVMVATGCSVGHRTLRAVDLGKTAVTFADSGGEPARAIRVWPHPLARSRAAQTVTDAPSRWHAQLAAYQIMPADALLCARPVVLTRSLAVTVSRPGVRVCCAECDEVIVNERQVTQDVRILCGTCAGDAYYQYLLESPASIQRPARAPAEHRHT